MRTANVSIEKRWLNEKELMGYTGLGRNTSRDIASKAGAVHKLGGRVLYDRKKVDLYLESTGIVDTKTAAL